jgi:hypothetical protein
MGVLDGAGQPPKAVTVRQTWVKVVKARAAEARRGHGTQTGGPSARPSPAAPIAAASGPSAATGTDEDLPAEEFQLKLAGGPKRWTDKGTNDA